MLEFIYNNLFYIFSLFALGGGIGLILSRHPLNSAISFVVTLFSIGGFYALLSAKMLFAMQIIVYAGAIMVLMIFVIMFLNVKEKDLLSEPKKTKHFSIVAIILSPIVLFISSIYVSSEPSELYSEFGEVKDIGKELFLEWVLPFELISILLLVSMIGAVVIAKSRD
jgi:NADH-quinone oxidoreductase subunit J